MEVDHPEAGPIRYPGAPFKMGETPWQIRRPAPLLGQDNEEILVGILDYSKKDLLRLEQDGVI